MAASMKMRVMVVDDCQEYAENLSELLDARGYDCIRAGSAERGLELARESPLLAVVTDFHLPGLNGVQFLRALRESGFDRPVVLMSAFADAAVTALAMEAGAHDVLAKPVNVDDLVGLLQGWESGCLSPA